MRVKLFDYQQEVLDSEAKDIYLNWARGMGKTFTVAWYIIKKRPETVAYNGRKSDLEEKFKEIKDSGYFFENNIAISIINGDIVLEFHDSFKVKIINIRDKSQDVLEYMNPDLYVFEDSIIGISNYSPKIVTGSRNVNDSIQGMATRSLNEESLVSNKDYKLAPKGFYDLQNVVDVALKDSNGFYDNYAILDKNHEEEQKMYFHEFQDKALQSLQKQFLDTEVSKDTVMTRKNLLEMIKDLNQLKQ